jgi:hypothetical protein
MPSLMAISLRTCNCQSSEPCLDWFAHIVEGDSMKRLIFQGMLIGMLITIVADSIHWFITASHQASGARRIAVAIQIVVIGAIAFWVWRRAKKDAELLQVMLPGKLTE